MNHANSLLGIAKTLRPSKFAKVVLIVWSQSVTLREMARGRVGSQPRRGHDNRSCWLLPRNAMPTAGERGKGGPDRHGVFNQSFLVALCVTNSNRTTHGL